MNSSDWEAWAFKRYGSVETARAIRRAAAAKSSRNKGKDSGFAKLKREDPERFKEITRSGGRAKAAKQANIQDSSEVK